MNVVNFEEKIGQSHPEWAIAKHESGNATWIDLVLPNNTSFTIQVTPAEGIGLSKRTSDRIDFGGHDEVFEDLRDVLDFLESQDA